MSVEKQPNDKWRVVWRQQDGRRRSRTFDLKGDAELFDAEVKRGKQLDGAFRQIEITLPNGKKTSRRQPTHVYVVVADDKVKIGIAGNPRQRLVGMRVSSPEHLTLVRTIFTEQAGQAARLEAALHDRYCAHHRRGEWFDREPVLADLQTLTDDDLIALTTSKMAA